MVCVPRTPRAASRLWLLLAAATTVLSKKDATKKSEPKLAPLGDVVFDFLDKDRNKEITIPEMQSQFMTLESISKAGGDGDAETQELRRIFQRLKRAAPYLFNLLDQDEDRRLDRDEAKMITRFEESLARNSNGKILVREWFDILDDDVDDRLDADEILEGLRSDFVLGEIADSLYELFPLRYYAYELKIHIQRAMRAMWGGDGEPDREAIAEGMRWLDYDGDGYVHWSEVTDAYNSFGQKFLSMATKIKEAGPMIGVFGDPSKKKKDDKEKKEEDTGAFKETLNVNKSFDIQAEAEALGLGTKKTCTK